jgi:hypothetical protein
MRAHIITGGIVANTIEVESLDFLPGLIAATAGSIGDLYANGVFSKPPAPPPVVPQTVTMRQARLALLQSGKLAAVATAIAAMASPQKEAAQIEWEYSQTVERQRPFVLLLGADLGLSDVQLDALFIVAAAL